MIRRLFVCAVIGIVLGCSGNDGKEDKAKGTVFDPQIQAVGKAKQVDKQIEDSAEKQRKEIDDQGG